jgi:K+ transporter
MAFGQMITLQDMIKQASNYPFNEMFYTLRNGKMQITFRPCIFKIKDFFKYAKQRVKKMDAHIVSYNLGFSDYERANCVLVHATGAIGQATEMATASKEGFHVDGDSIKKYGLRKMEITTKFAQPRVGTKEDNSSIQLINQFRDLLVDYGFSKHKFLNGPISIIGNNDYRIGDFIQFTYKGEEIIAKVEHVMEEWSWGNSIRVTLALSHGFKADGTFYTGKLEDGTNSILQFKK